MNQVIVTFCVCLIGAGMLHGYTEGYTAMDKGTVAPHINNEVRLVLAGTKPLATIERSKDESNYAMAISLIGAGMLKGYATPTSDCPSGEVTIVRPSQRYILHEYRDLQDNGIRLFGIKEYHRKMGRLFGYTNEDIEAFIKSDIQCECSKCCGR